MKDKEYEAVKSDFIKISSETRSKLTALSVSVIAAIYFFSNDQNAEVLRTSLALFFATITIEVLAGFCKSQHYAKWIDGDLKDIGYRQSLWGWASEILFYVPLLTFTAASVLFFNGISL